MERLLNQLIELGWKPYGNVGFNYQLAINELGKRTLLNDICSLDSGLRQFVCEKGLYKMNDEGELDIRGIQNERKEQFARGIVALSELSEDGAGGDLEKEVNFRLMLSSIQEDKETFLLTNIIIPDGKTKETD